MNSESLTEHHPLEMVSLQRDDPDVLMLASRIISCTYPDDTGCLIWRKAKDHDGYGVTFFRSHQWRVHRAVFFLWVGDIPERSFVLHHCDNPTCCNPSHLFLGDARINRHDCRAKGRMTIQRGELRYNCILNETKVREIRRRYKWRDKDNNAVALGNEFGVTVGAVWGILRGRTWKHIT